MNNSRIYFLDESSICRHFELTKTDFRLAMTHNTAPNKNNGSRYVFLGQYGFRGELPNGLLNILVEPEQNYSIILETYFHKAGWIIYLMSGDWNDLLSMVKNVNQKNKSIFLCFHSSVALCKIHLHRLWSSSCSIILFIQTIIYCPKHIFRKTTGKNWFFYANKTDLKNLHCNTNWRLKRNTDLLFP